MKKISFNIPYKLKNLKKFDNFKTYAGNGIWTKKIQNRLSKKYSFKKVLLTDSCTSALEIAALSLKLNLLIATRTIQKLINNTLLNN